MVGNCYLQTIRLKSKSQLTAKLGEATTLMDRRSEGRRNPPATHLLFYSLPPVIDKGLLDGTVRSRIEGRHMRLLRTELDGVGTEPRVDRTFSYPSSSSCPEFYCGSNTFAASQLCRERWKYTI